MQYCAALHKLLRRHAVINRALGQASDRPCVARSRPSPAASVSTSRSRSGGTAVVLWKPSWSVGWRRPVLRGTHGSHGSSAGHAVDPTVGNGVVSYALGVDVMWVIDDTSLVYNEYIQFIYNVMQRQPNYAASSRSLIRQPTKAAHRLTASTDGTHSVDSELSNRQLTTQLSELSLSAYPQPFYILRGACLVPTGHGTNQSGPTS